MKKKKVKLIFLKICEILKILIRLINQTQFQAKLDFFFFKSTVIENFLLYLLFKFVSKFNESSIPEKFCITC